MLWITLVLFIVGEVVAQKESLVPCPAYLPLFKLNLNDLVGTWYEIGNDDPVNDKSRCATIEYSLATGNVLMIKHTKILQKTTMSTTGKAKLNNLAKDGLFEVTYELTKNKLIDELHQVVESDYKTWAVVSDCGNFGNKKIARILTRVRNPNQAILDKAYKAAGSNQKEFPLRDQKNC